MSEFAKVRLGMAGFYTNGASVGNAELRAISQRSQGRCPVVRLQFRRCTRASAWLHSAA